VADPKILKRGEIIYKLRPHLSQMRTTKYMHFTRKSGFFEKKYDPVGGGRPHRTRPLNPQLPPVAL